jgi:hypothetical protein
MAEARTCRDRYGSIPPRGILSSRADGGPWPARGVRRRGGRKAAEMSLPSPRSARQPGHCRLPSEWFQRILWAALILVGCVGDRPPGPRRAAAASQGFPGGWRRVVGAFAQVAPHTRSREAVPLGAAGERLGCPDRRRVLDGLAARRAPSTAGQLWPSMPRICAISAC